MLRGQYLVENVCFTSEQGRYTDTYTDTSFVFIGLTAFQGGSSFLDLAEELSAYWEHFDSSWA